VRHIARILSINILLRVLLHKQREEIFNFFPWEILYKISNNIVGIRVNVMLCYVMLCYAMLYYVMLCYVMLCYAMLCYFMLCYVILCYVMLCYVMLCYVMLCYAMLCYAMLCYPRWTSCKNFLFVRSERKRVCSVHLAFLTTGETALDLNWR